jgi:hypothetical protein
VLPRPSPTAIFKQLAEGAVLFSTSDEVYFGVNSVGARIWELLPPVTSTFTELVRELAKTYSDVDLERIRTDARKYLDELLASGLVIPVEGQRELSGAESVRQSDTKAD